MSLNRTKKTTAEKMEDPRLTAVLIEREKLLNEDLYLLRSSWAHGLFTLIVDETFKNFGLSHLDPEDPDYHLFSLLTVIVTSILKLYKSSFHPRPILITIDHLSTLNDDSIQTREFIRKWNNNTKSIPSEDVLENLEQSRDKLKKSIRNKKSGTNIFYLTLLAYLIGTAYFAEKREIYLPYIVSCFTSLLMLTSLVPDIKDSISTYRANASFSRELKSKTALLRKAFPPSSFCSFSVNEGKNIKSSTFVLSITPYDQLSQKMTAQLIKSYLLKNGVIIQNDQHHKLVISAETHLDQTFIDSSVIDVLKLLNQENELKKLKRQLAKMGEVIGETGVDIRCKADDPNQVDKSFIEYNLKIPTELEKIITQERLNSIFVKSKIELSHSHLKISAANAGNEVNLTILVQEIDELKKQQAKKDLQLRAFHQQPSTSLPKNPLSINNNSIKNEKQEQQESVVQNSIIPKPSLTKMGIFNNNGKVPFNSKHLPENSLFGSWQVPDEEFKSSLPLKQKLRNKFFECMDKGQMGGKNKQGIIFIDEEIDGYHADIKFKVLGENGSGNVRVYGHKNGNTYVFDKLVKKAH